MLGWKSEVSGMENEKVNKEYTTDLANTMGLLKLSIIRIL